MSVLWLDDPNFYSTAQIVPRFDSNAGTLGTVWFVSPGNGRFGNNSLRMNAGGGGYYLLKGLTSAPATGTLAVSLRIVNMPGARSPLFSCVDSGSTQVDLQVNNTGNLIVTRGGNTILATSTLSLTAGVWYRIEFQVTINNTTGSIEVKVNGVDWIGPTSSLNTRATTNNSFNQVTLGGMGTTANSQLWDYNDFAVTDSNSPNAGFLGDKRVFLREPISDSSVAYANTWSSWAASTVMAVGQQYKDGNGNVQQVTAVTGDAKTGSSAPTWATTGGLPTTDNHVTTVVVGSGANPGAHNWMAVSEEPADDDNSYNSDSNPGDIDLFNLSSLPAGVQNISAIDNVIKVRKDDAGTRTIESWISSSGVTAGGANLNLSTSYIYDDFVQETDPNTSAAWTAAAANALKVGYKEIA